MITSQEKTENKSIKLITGEVVSTRMKDTIVVLVRRYRKHPKYGKFLVRSKRVKVHDKGNTCSVGDVVSLRQTKPISKDKHFVVQDVVTKSKNNNEESESSEGNS